MLERRHHERLVPCAHQHDRTRDEKVGRRGIVREVEEREPTGLIWPIHHDGQSRQVDRGVNDAENDRDDRQHLEPLLELELSTAARTFPFLADVVHNELSHCQNNCDAERDDIESHRELHVGPQRRLEEEVRQEHIQDQDPENRNSPSSLAEELVQLSGLLEEPQEDADPRPIERRLDSLVSIVHRLQNHFLKEANGDDERGNDREAHRGVIGSDVHPLLRAIHQARESSQVDGRIHNRDEEAEEDDQPLLKRGGLPADASHGHKQQILKPCRRDREGPRDNCRE